MRTAEVMLDDLEQFTEMKKPAEELIDEMKMFKKDQFDNWSREMLRAIDDPNNPIG